MKLCLLRRVLSGVGPYHYDFLGTVLACTKDKVSRSLHGNLIEIGDLQLTINFSHDAG